MENQDKLDQHYKNAADKAENKGFDRMEAVWNRVEEKLDNRKKRRAAYWKYSGIAAMLLVFLGLGSLFFKTDTTPQIEMPQATPQPQVVTIDTNRVKEAVAPENVDALKGSEKVVVNDKINDTLTQLKKQRTANPKAYVSKSGRNLIEEVKHKELSNPHGDIIINPSNSYRNTAIAEGDMIIAKDKYANPNIVTGIVADNTGPLPGASVFVKGTQKAVQTDMEGKFSIEAKEGEQLEISYISFITKKIAIGKANELGLITLEQNSLTLEAVVVSAYKAETVKKSVTASVTTLSSQNTAGNQSYANNRNHSDGDMDKDFESLESRAKAQEIKLEASVKAIQDRANASIVQSLQGQVAGLNITSGSGQPGSDSTIILRGAGTINENIEPLFIVDGVPVDEDGFRSLNQNDIASFKILKDAAATSIYGNRGANGVIVITTKNSSYKPVLGLDISKSDPSITERNAILNSITTLRGNEEPLFVVDGIAMDKASFFNLNLNDVASVKVLKDASATALYGNRGSNGVVVIKTKQGPFTFEEDEPQDEVPENEKIKIDQEEYEWIEENPFENPAMAPLSTFSIDVDNASYTNIRRFINDEETVPKDAVRVEEMINFFKYEYPQPTGKEPFSINTEYSDAPWNPNHKLLKIGLKGREILSAQLPASNFVFLIDVSGSMSDDNKLPLLKESMKLLVKQMSPEDRIAIVVYAGAAGLVLPSTSGADKDKIIAALDDLEAGGSTAGGEGIELAYKTAVENFIKKGNNRVILATDGDFNVGPSSDSDMEHLIEEKRKSGVFLTCLGYGMGNYKDSKMEVLADKGNGNYAYIDSMHEADRFLQKEFKGSMFAIAKDVKIQVEFNPVHVQSYRLIGYENRKLRDEDFENDAIDAGELGSGHTVTALYEIIPTGVYSDFYIPESDLKYRQPSAANGNYSNELATVKLRHKKPDGNKSTETVQIVPNQSIPLNQASGDFKFAASAAWFGLKLRDSKLIKDKSSKHIIRLAKESLENDPDGYRAEFIELVKKVE